MMQRHNENRASVRMGAIAAGMLCALGALPARAADRAPIAVVWMGDADSLEAGAQKTVNDINAALARTAGARPLDSIEDRRALVDGGPTTKVQLLLRRAEQSFVKLKYADAVKDYEAAELLLLEDVPLDVLRRQIGDVERNLLACYDQLGRAADAARAAERLTWAAGGSEDMKRLMDRYWLTRAWTPALPPVTVTTEPPGAVVSRNLRELGPAPQTMPGGDSAIDVLDIELPGYRRAHRALGAGETIKVALAKEDRLGVLVDSVRAQAPDAAPRDVAAIGRRVGARRVLVVLPDGPKKLLGRWLDVDKAAWAPDPIRVDSGGAAAMDKLASYAAPAPVQPPLSVAAVAPQPEKKKSRIGPWGKWYTWVAAGAVVVLVGGLLIAQNVGSDSVDISASH